MTMQQPKEGFNLSKWALDHGPLTKYLMVVLMVERVVEWVVEWGMLGAYMQGNHATR